MQHNRKGIFKQNKRHFTGKKKTLSSCFDFIPDDVRRLLGDQLEAGMYLEEKMLEGRLSQTGICDSG